MLRSILVITGVVFSAFTVTHAQAVELYGRVQFESDTHKFILVLTPSKEFFDEERIGSVYLDNVTAPIVGVTFGLDSMDWDGQKIYSNDFIKVSGTGFKKVGIWTYLENPKLVEVVDPNPRIECHSRVKNGWLYALTFGYPSVESATNPGTFMRMDTCSVEDSVKACSNTWGAGYYFTKDSSIPKGSSLRIATSYDSHLLYNSGGQDAFYSKYGRETYFESFFKYGKTFEMTLTSELSFEELPNADRTGIFGLEDRALENTSNGVRENAKVTWKATTGDLFIDGEIPLYCYRWY